jgi:hypothetical protein
MNFAIHESDSMDSYLRTGWTPSTVMTARAVRVMMGMQRAGCGRGSATSFGRVILHSS